MVFESKRDMSSNDKFILDFDAYGFGLYNYSILTRDTYYVRLDTDTKSIVIYLYYTKDVFRLNKILQKGYKFNLSYIIDDAEVYNGLVVIEEVTLNLSKENNHQPTVILYCECE